MKRLDECQNNKYTPRGSIKRALRVSFCFALMFIVRAACNSKGRECMVKIGSYKETVLDILDSFNITADDISKIPHDDGTIFEFAFSNAAAEKMFAINAKELPKIRKVMIEFDSSGKAVRYSFMTELLPYAGEPRTRDEAVIQLEMIASLLGAREKGYGEYRESEVDQETWIYIGEFDTGRNSILVAVGKPLSQSIYFEILSNGISYDILS